MRTKRIILRVRTVSALLEATAASLRDVNVIADCQMAERSVRCGPRAEPEEIYLTWRVSAERPQAGTAVAIEILLMGFVPEP